MPRFAWVALGDVQKVQLAPRRERDLQRVREGRAAQVGKIGRMQN